jgi:type II secretory pathway predicted ATPase ExeA
MARSPFDLVPNPNTLYLTAALRAVLHKCRLSIDKRQGLTAILGDKGLGKSTLLRYLWNEYIANEQYATQFIATPDFGSKFQMMREICTGFGCDTKRSFYAQHKEFEAFLVKALAEEKCVILFLDEAQMFNSDQLELLRTLLNFETNEDKLMQIAITGTLELRDRLLTKKHRPLKSRIFAPSMLNPFTYDEMVGMLKFRIARENLAWTFTEGALERLYDFSAGSPREILMGAHVAWEYQRVSGVEMVTEEMMESALADVNMKTEAENQAAAAEA